MKTATLARWFVQSSTSLNCNLNYTDTKNSEKSEFFFYAGVKLSFLILLAYNEDGDRMIRTMTEQELKKVYAEYMMIDFPEDERKPLHVILSRFRKKQNLCLCYVEGDDIKGYSILEFSEKNRCLLMDYFAVLPDVRNQGIGTRFMQEMKEYFKDWNALLIESECAFDEISKKRLEFYQGCGAFISHEVVHLYHVNYEILAIPLNQNFELDQVKKVMNEIYEKISPKAFQKLFLRWK